MENVEKCSQHGREIRYCIPCGGRAICHHKTVRSLCRVCSPLGWAKSAIRHLKNHAVKNGYEPPRATPKEVVLLMRTAELCVLCNEPLDWSEGHHLHHNHVTGVVEGFAHGFCNLTEGRIGKLALSARSYFLNRLLKAGNA